MNPYLAMLKTLKQSPAVPPNPPKGAYGGFGGNPDSPVSETTDPFGGFGGSPSDQIQESIPDGLRGRLHALIDRKLMTVAQAEEVLKRYHTNADVWQSKVVAIELAAGLLACQRCTHFRTPGFSTGYCSGRDDLPPAYGETHPLRVIPIDGGHSCDTFKSGGRR